MPEPLLLKLFLPRREPAYNLVATKVPMNTWRTETISLAAPGKVWAFLGPYLNSTSVLSGATQLNQYYNLGSTNGRQVNCYQPLAWWMNSANTCTQGGGAKKLPWFLDGEFWGCVSAG
jgi:hypothetical protein